MIVYDIFAEPLKGQISVNLDSHLDTSCFLFHEDISVAERRSEKTLLTLPTFLGATGVSAAARTKRRQIRRLIVAASGGVAAAAARPSTQEDVAVAVLQGRGGGHDGVEAVTAVETPVCRLVFSSHPSRQTE